MPVSLLLLSLGVGALVASTPVAAGQSADRPMARPAQSSYPLPPPPPTGLPLNPVTPLEQMTPFPIVRIVGRATPRGARIRIFSVRAPVGTTIVVRCRRRGCSRRSRSRGRGIRRTVRFRRFERASRAGTIIEVLVSAPDVIGKYTRFRIRRSRSPARADLCLLPGESRGSECPED